MLPPLFNNAFRSLHFAVLSTNIACPFRLLHHSRIINSTSFDSARHWSRRPDPGFLAKYTPAHSSGETKGSGEGASLPRNQAVVSFAALISPDHRGHLLMRVLGLVQLSARCPPPLPYVRTVRLTDIYECYDGLAKDIRKCQHRAYFERD